MVCWYLTIFRNHGIDSFNGKIRKPIPLSRGGEMVDTIGLGPIALKSVEVQVLSPALNENFPLRENIHFDKLERT